MVDTIEVNVNGIRLNVTLTTPDIESHSKITDDISKEKARGIVPAYDRMRSDIHTAVSEFITGITENR